MGVNPILDNVTELPVFLLKASLINVIIFLELKALLLDQKDPNLDKIFAEKSVCEIFSQLKVEWFENIEWFHEGSPWPGFKLALGKPSLKKKR